MSHNALYVHVLLDRSGSMEVCRSQTIKAFNEYVASLKEAWKTPARLSLTLFDSGSIDLVIDARPVAEMPDLDNKTFVPRGNTPLLDAVGVTIGKIDAAQLADGERVVFVILTDGEENSSREHSRESIKRLLAERREMKHWLVLFLGAGEEAWDERQSLGLSMANSLQLRPGNVGRVMASAARATRIYAAAARPVDAALAASFTDDERIEAMADDSDEAPPNPRGSGKGRGKNSKD